MEQEFFSCESSIDVQSSSPNPLNHTKETKVNDLKETTDFSVQKTKTSKSKIESENEKKMSSRRNTKKNDCEFSPDQNRVLPDVVMDIDDFLNKFPNIKGKLKPGILNLYKIITSLSFFSIHT